MQHKKNSKIHLQPIPINWNLKSQTSIKPLSSGQLKKKKTHKTVTEMHSLTIDWCFSWQNDHDKLQPSVSVLEVSEHGLHAVGSLGVFAEAGLALDGHPSIPGNLPQLFCEGPGGCT